MTIDPRDLRRLIIRVCLVTVAMRAVSLFSVDLSPGEVSALLGLHADGERATLLSGLMGAWSQVSATIRAVLRLPVLVSDVALVLLALAFTRVQGWGSVSGLLTGLILAMAPFGLDEGWRADGTALLSVCALGPLVLLRQGLRGGRVGPVVLSAVALTAGVVLSPLVALVALPGLYAAVRSVTGPGPRNAALAGWVLGPLAAVGLRMLWLDQPGPGLGLAASWLADSALNGGRPALPTSPWQAFTEALAALSPGGPVGALASQIEVVEAPMWRVWIGVALWPLALWGFFRGQVQEDPRLPVAPVSLAVGVGAVDGWRSLGVGVSTAPRTLGERDLGPLLLGVLLCAGWVAWAAARGAPHGIAEALAVGRPLAALLLGVGLTAVAWRDDEAEPRRARKRFVAIMVGLALLLFGLGAHHIYDGTQRLDRMAARKVATFAASDLSPSGRVLCLGPAGLSVSWILMPGQTHSRVQRRSLAPTEALAGLEAALGENPAELIVAGDRVPLDGAVPGKTGQGVLGARLDARLDAAGFALQEDGHRYLAEISVRAYSRSVPAPGAIIPQLYPGKAP